jgi:hypothetical protein
MSCNSCKRKNVFKEEMNKTTNFVNKSAIWIMLIWSALSIYGLYSLIRNFL